MDLRDGRNARGAGSDLARLHRGTLVLVADGATAVPPENLTR